MLAFFRSANPRVMPTVHQVQARLGDKVIPPAFVLILLFGIYLATTAHAWGEVWVIAPVIVLIAIDGSAPSSSDRRMSDWPPSRLPMSAPRELTSPSPGRTTTSRRTAA